MRRGRVARVKRRLMQCCGGGGPPCFLRIWPTSLLCSTVDEMVPVYAPSSDQNDVAAYIAAIEHAVDTWRRGQLWA